MRYPAKQKGITFIGLLMVAALVGFFAYIGMKLVPIYIENYGVKAALKALSEEDTQDVSTSELRSRVMKRLSVNNVEGVKPENVDVKAMGRSRVVSVNYEVRSRFFDKIYLLAVFSESTVLTEN
ncbi:MAG: DUF4845 domain-containing protein [Chromatiales bacterium]|jgi:Tfp pilus assembly major pilin PilA|nr:DUF4845 domain-containing protein [Chromatiales bacterium]